MIEYQWVQFRGSEAKTKQVGCKKASNQMQTCFRMQIWTRFLDADMDMGLDADMGSNADMGSDADMGMVTVIELVEQIF